MSNITKSKLILSFILSWFVMFFDPYLLLLKAIGILVVLDIVTGILAARKEGKELNSRSFWSKVPKVGLFLIALAAAREASPLLIEFGIEANQAGKWFCSLYGIYELFSILENLGRLGMPVAKTFIALLKAKLPDELKTLDPSEDPTLDPANKPK